MKPDDAAPQRSLSAPTLADYGQTAALRDPERNSIQGVDNRSASTVRGLEPVDPKQSVFLVVLQSLMMADTKLMSD
jgi:hypothetical protein